MVRALENEKNYLVPDYFFDFRCKMGACRCACCEGWPISVSLKDYFSLLSADVSKELRIKLDCALHIAPNPSPEAYAQILPRYDGQCPMRMSDGRCALHFELGEYALSDVCRLYPRGVREDECSCANSCEAVIEMLMEREEKIRFVNTKLGFRVPEIPERKHFFETAGCEKEIRKHLISIMQMREYALIERIALMGMTLKALDEALKGKDHESVLEIVGNRAKIHLPAHGSPTRDDLLIALEIANQMLYTLDERSDSIRAYGENSLNTYGTGEHEFDVYMKNKALFERAFPDWETWFEHMYVNHMFFSQFPFQDRPVDLGEEYLALISVYMLLRFLLIGNACEDYPNEKAADIAAAVFRLVEHTEFDRYAGPIMKRVCRGDYENALRVLSL